MSEQESFRTNEDPRSGGNTADVRKELPTLQFEINKHRPIIEEEEKDLDPKLDEVSQILLREPSNLHVSLK
jgi:hypothetical protein